MQHRKWEGQKPKNEGRGVAGLELELELELEPTAISVPN